MNIDAILARIDDYYEPLTLDQRVHFINLVKDKLHSIGPFKSEPVDCVKWVKAGNVKANDYNPNKVAPPEMELLRISISNDGYTQPVVTWLSDAGREVIDGFHRSRVCTEYSEINKRVHGYLPVVTIRSEQTGKNDRVASTIRHNRARGKHQIDAMSEIILELKRRNWRNPRIARELGMDEEEVLRLCQITGLEDLFQDNDFSRAWEASESKSVWEDLTDSVHPDEIAKTRIPNEGKGDRIFHTWDKWECFPAGFYASCVSGKTAEQCQESYRVFLSDLDWFRDTLGKVTSEWKHSCEHYLTNFAMNRIAWLGQASACYSTGIPSRFCGGFNLLTDKQKTDANMVALEALNSWLAKNGRKTIGMDEAMSIGRQVETY